MRRPPARRAEVLTIGGKRRDGRDHGLLLPEQLYLCRAQGRIARGKLIKRAPSRFLLQIPEELLEARDVLEPPRPQVAETHRGASDVLAAILGSGA